MIPRQLAPKGRNPMITRKRVLAVLAFAAAALVTWGAVAARAADSWS